MQTRRRKHFATQRMRPAQMSRQRRDPLGSDRIRKNREEQSFRRRRWRLKRHESTLLSPTTHA
jgi:hypothetical protein